MDDMIIRDATADDLQAINDIYNHYVLNCTCTWQTEPEPMPARVAWFEAHQDRLPILVAEVDGRVAGWASLSSFHSRCGWRGTVEDSVYIHPEMQGRGLGRGLLEALLTRAKECGVHSVVGVISGDQKRSLQLHARLGFMEVGRLKEAGEKFGYRLDAVYMQKML